MLHNATSYIIPGIAVLTAAAGIVAYFKSTADSATKKYLTDAVRARDIAIADKDKAIAALEATCAQKDQTIAELKKHNGYLQRLAQGSPQLKLLSEQFKKLTAALEQAVSLKASNAKNK